MGKRVNDDSELAWERAYFWSQHEAVLGGTELEVASKQGSNQKWRQMCWTGQRCRGKARDGQGVEPEMTQKGWHRSQWVFKLDGSWT